MIKVKYIPNILEHKGRKEKTLRWHKRKTVVDYINEMDLHYTTGNDIRIINSKDGQEIGLAQTLPQCPQELIITPILNDPVTTIVTIVVGITTGYYAYKSYQEMKEVSEEITQIQPVPVVEPPPPVVPSYGGSSFSANGYAMIEEGSPTYGWDQIYTTMEVGRPVPIVYGQHKVGGNIINQYVTNNGEKSYLNVLLALAEGEIEEITGTKVNDNPIANFSGVTEYKRYGTTSQSVVPNFNDQHNVYTLSTTIGAGSSYTYTTSDNDVEAFEINFTMPSGLFTQNSTTGAIQNKSISITIGYRIFGSGDPYTNVNKTLTRKTKTAQRFSKRVDGLTAGQYDIKITNNNSADTAYTQSTLQLTSIDEIQTDDIAYIGTALYGIKLLATEQISGSTPNITNIIKGKKVSIPKVMYDGNEVDWEDYYWDPATSAYKRFSDDMSCTWDGSTYVDRWCSNPVWCLKDLLTNTRYGVGDFIDTSNIDEDLFLEMSRYCEEKLDDGASGYEKRFYLDIVLDSQTRALDAINQICSSFRAIPFYSEGTIKFRIDKAESSTMMFTMGSIIKGSYQQEWKGFKDKPNVIQVTYTDADNDYIQETIEYEDSESLYTNGEPRRVKAFRIFTTRMSQAIREARYLLKREKYMDETITFVAGINSIGCLCGDVVDFQHDVPQWNFGGRVQASSTTTLIKLDQQITIGASESWICQIHYADDDTIEQQDITDGAGNYTEVNTDAFSKAPSAYDQYIVGKNTIKTFRIMGIEKQSNDEVKITATEYDTNVFDDTAITIPTNNYSALDNSVPDVGSLTLTEDIAKLADGTIESYIDVYFMRPVDTSYHLKRYKSAKIYLSEGTGGEHYLLKGETEEEYMRIMGGLVENQEYTVVVCSVSDKGEMNAIADSPSSTITVQGKTAPPDDVTGFDVNQQADMLRFTWNANDDADLARYIIKKGGDWPTGTTIGELVDTTEFQYPVGQIGEQSYMVKAIDTSGNESTNPAIDTITVTQPPEMNFLQEIDIWSLDHDYILSGVGNIWGNKYNEDYARKMLALNSAETWEDWEASGDHTTWEDDEANVFVEGDAGAFVASGKWEQNDPYDLEAIFEFKVVVDADYSSVANCTLTSYINYSEDNSTWSGFEEINASITYRARYLKFKFVIATSDTAYNLYFYGCTIYINAPVSLVDWGSDVAIPDTGKTILFGVDFTFAPRVVATITNGISGIPIVSNKTTDQFEIDVYDLDGNAIGTAEIDWEAKGY